MGALDDLTRKTQDFIEENKDQIQEVLNSEQAEDISDKIIGGVSEAAKKVTGGRFDEQIDGAAAAADRAVGTEP